MARIADQEEAVFAQESVDSIKTLRQNANYKQADLIKRKGQAAMWKSQRTTNPTCSIQFI